jgi:hypothetical protein
MESIFNKSFFKFALSFLGIIAVSFLVTIIAGYYGEQGGVRDLSASGEECGDSC